jgi:hypothetical protein
MSPEPRLSHFRVAASTSVTYVGPEMRLARWYNAGGYKPLNWIRTDFRPEKCVR